MTDKNTNEFLRGYRGGQFFGAPLVWSPYIPFMTTLNIPKKFVKRFAETTINPNYYGKITITMSTKYDRQYWDRKIENVMNQFDFVRTYRVMEALDWEWCDQGVPDVEDQRETARDLLERIVDDRFSKPEGRLGTGGFMAEIDTNTGFLGLYFIAAEWEECDE